MADLPLFVAACSVVINLLVLLSNATILAVTVKLWTEIVKAENIKRIGKV